MRTASIRRWLHGTLLAGWMLAFAGAASGVERSIECRVLYETADGFYVDAGSAAGLEPGTLGVVKRDAADLGRVEVVQVSKNTASVRLLATTNGTRPAAQDRVLFVVNVPDDAATGKDQPSASTTLKEGDDKDFVPLLAPYSNARGANYSDPDNLFHGHLRVRQQSQLDSKGNQDYSRTRLGSNFTLDRIDGTPWSLEGSGDVSYRTGNAYQGSSLDGGRLDVYQLSLFRKFDGGDSVRLGRFLPLQLPGVGFVDGAQGETVVSDHFRAGAIGGFKPRISDLAPSFDQPAFSFYGTGEFGKPRDFYYSGTAGVLSTLFKGKPDQLALLLDQRADFGSALSLFSTQEVDFNVGAAEQRSGPQLTRLDFYAVVPVSKPLTLRAGLDHYQRPDTEAERSLLGFLDQPNSDPNDLARLFDRGYWRYWVGSSLSLPWNFRADDEISFINAPDQNLESRWRVTLSRTGTLVPRDYMALTVFNLVSFDSSKGYGGRLFGSFPLFDDRLTLRPSVGYRYLVAKDVGETLKVNDADLYVDWWLSKTVSLYAGVSHTFDSSLDATLVDVGLDFRW